jgi:uncharacterized protein YcnI
MHVSLPPRLWRRGTLGALVVTVLVALPAAAHPFVRGGEVPVDSVATITLAMAHGCGTEDSGGGDPTTEIALEVPDQLRVVEVAEDPEYSAAYEVGDDGRIEVITWTATGEGEPAPDLEFDAVLTGEVGDEVYLRVFQGCEGFAYRWIGTPDDPADDPAVRVTLVEADAAAPPPPPDEATPAEVEAAPGPDAPEDEATEDEAPEDDSIADTDSEADVDGEVGADDATDDAAVDLEADAAGGGDEGGGLPVLVPIVVALVLAGLGVVLARRSRGTDGGAASDGEPV